MYTHARQFPHLTGKSDEEIRAIYGRALAKRPIYRSLWLARNLILFFVIVPIEIAALYKLAGLRLSTAFFVAGSTALLLGIAWNIVWVNMVTYRITRDVVSESPKP
jgi:hypothetical protein